MSLHCRPCRIGGQRAEMIALSLRYVLWGGTLLIRPLPNGRVRGRAYSSAPPPAQYSFWLGPVPILVKNAIGFFLLPLV